MNRSHSVCSRRGVVASCSLIAALAGTSLAQSASFRVLGDLSGTHQGSSGGLGVSPDGSTVVG